MGEWSALGWGGFHKVQVTGELESWGAVSQVSGNVSGASQRLHHMPSAHPILFHHEPLLQRVRLAQIHCPLLHMQPPLRFEVASAPCPRAVSPGGGGQVGSICAQRQHTAASTPQSHMPFPSPGHGRPQPPRPETAHHPLPRSSREPHRRNTCPADTYPLWTEGARRGWEKTCSEVPPRPSSFK